MLALRKADDLNRVRASSPLDLSDKRVAGWLHQRRGRERLAPMLFYQSQHPPQGCLPSGPIAIEVHTTDALQCQRVMLVQQRCHVWRSSCELAPADATYRPPLLSLRLTWVASIAQKGQSEPAIACFVGLRGSLARSSSAE